MIEKYLRGYTKRPLLEKAIKDKDLEPLYKRQQKIIDQVAKKK
jgi:hypothetical protein